MAAIKEQIQRLSSLSMSQKILAFVVLCLLIDVGFYLTQIKPAQGELEQMTREYKRTEKKNGDLKKKKFGATVKTATVQIAHFKRELAKREETLPKEERIEELISDLEKLAAVSNLRVRSYVRLEKAIFEATTTGKKGKKKKSKQKFGLVPVQLHVEGTTENLLKFFLLLGNPDGMKRLVSIDNLEIKWIDPRFTSKKGQLYENCGLTDQEQGLLDDERLRISHKDLVVKLEALLSQVCIERQGNVKAMFTVNAFQQLSKDDLRKLKTK